jgi:hypothetical protein
MKSTDPMNHKLMLSLGLFVENLSFAAGTLGLKTDVTILSEDFSGSDIMEIN